MKLVHKVILPATIIVAMSIGNISYACKDTKVLKDSNIVSVVRVVKNTVPVDDNQKKDKLNSARKKAKKNLKDSLDKKVRNNEISQGEAEKIFAEFESKMKNDCVNEFRPQVEIFDKKSDSKRLFGAGTITPDNKEFEFRRNFKESLFKQARDGRISFERAEDIYNNFSDVKEFAN